MSMDKLIKQAQKEIRYGLNQPMLLQAISFLALNVFYIVPGLCLLSLVVMGKLPMYWQWMLLLFVVLLIYSIIYGNFARQNRKNYLNHTLPALYSELYKDLNAQVNNRKDINPLAKGIPIYHLFSEIKFDEDFAEIYAYPYVYLHEAPSSDDIDTDTCASGLHLIIKPKTELHVDSRVKVDFDTQSRTAKALINFQRYMTHKLEKAESETGEELKAVKMEDPHFENNFSVFAVDPLAAHQLLTPYVMNQYTEMRKKYGTFLTEYKEGLLYITFYRYSMLGNRKCTATGYPLNINKTDLMNAKNQMLEMIKNIHVLWED